jgi:hypothetical protein
MMKRIFLPILSVCLGFHSCEEELPSDPLTEMVSVSALSASDYFVKARIVQTGDAPITDYGFTVSRFTIDPGLTYNSEFRVGFEPETDTFSYLISYEGYDSDTALYFRSYLVNKYGRMYSKPFRLSLNRVRPYGITPAWAEQGDTVTLIGSGFDLAADGNTVLFGEISAKVLSVSPHELKVIVPLGIHHSAGGIEVYVTRDGLKSQFGYFRVVPRILSITPLTGTFNSEVQINFDNLSSSYWDYNVDFGTVGAWSRRSNGNNIIVHVPPTVKSKNLPIRVYTDYAECLPVMKFTMDPMTVTSLTPSQGPVKLVLVLYGRGFNPDAKGNAIKIGAKYAYIGYSDIGVLCPTVPADLSPGTYDVTIYNTIDTLVIKNGYTVTN